MSTLISKPLLILAAIIIVALGVWLFISHIRLSDANNALDSANARIIGLSAQIAQAEGLIASQNTAIDKLTLDIDKSSTELSAEYLRLTKKYDLLKKQSAGLIDGQATCEEQLSAIKSAQELFCYER